MNDIADATILVVDDEEANVLLLERLLQRHGFQRVVATQDPAAALTLARQQEPDLVLLDLMMPELDGFAVMDRLFASLPADTFLPVLVLTADVDVAVRYRALEAGAMDFVTKPFDAVEVVQRVYNLLHTRLLYRNQRDHRAELERAVRQRTQALTEANQELHVVNAALGKVTGEILIRLARAAEYRDDDTGQHTERVGRMSALTARQLGLADDFCSLLGQAARLHDLGKIGVPDSVLLKPGRLDAEEWSIMQSHCEIGAAILSDSSSELLALAERISLHHHERFDGSGYPRGLAGEDIPIEGRIVAVVDVFDALTHARPYKRAWSQHEAVRLLREERGRHFDPAVVDAFLEVLLGVPLAVGQG